MALILELIGFNLSNFIFAVVAKIEAFIPGRFSMGARVKQAKFRRCEMLLKTLFALILTLSINLAYPVIASASPAYVGNAGCSFCHMISNLSWEMSVHAKAFETLRAGAKKQEKLNAKLDPGKDYTNDKDCLKCHTTGYRETGGFKDISSTPKMAGIGCESCHGPGSEYRGLHAKNKNFTKAEAKAAGQVYGSLDESVCTSCHLSKDSPFTEKIDKKYKYDHQKALDDRKSYHKKEPVMDH